MTTEWFWLIAFVLGLAAVITAAVCRQRYDSPATVVLLASAAVRLGYALDWLRMWLKALDAFLCQWVELRRATRALPRVWGVIRVKGGERGEAEEPRRVQRSAAVVSPS